MPRMTEGREMGALAMEQGVSKRRCLTLFDLLGFFNCCIRIVDHADRARIPKPILVHIYLKWLLPSS
jgi:hypothetical protein